MGSASAIASGSDTANRRSSSAAAAAAAARARSGWLTRSRGSCISGGELAWYRRGMFTGGMPGSRAALSVRSAGGGSISRRRSSHEFRVDVCRSLIPSSSTSNTRCADGGIGPEPSSP